MKPELYLIILWSEALHQSGKKVYFLKIYLFFIMEIYPYIQKKINIQKKNPFYV